MLNQSKGILLDKSRLSEYASIFVLLLLIFGLVINNFDSIKNDIKEKKDLIILSITIHSQLTEQCNTICKGACLSVSPGFKKVDSTYNINSCDCLCSNDIKEKMSISKDVGPCPNKSSNCNGACLIPSSKKAGEKYNCLWECNSGNGNGYNCLPTKRESEIERINWILGLLILIYVVGLSTMFFWGKNYDKRIIKKREELKNIDENVKNLENVKKTLEKEINNAEFTKTNLKEKIESLNEDKIRNEKKIKEIERKLKNKEGIAKEIHEKELEKLKIKNKKIRLQIEQDRSGLREQEELIRLKKEKLSSETQEINESIRIRDTLAEQTLINTKKEIEAALAKYRRRHGNNIMYDERGGYLVFTSVGNKPLHRWIYEEIDKNLSSEKEVHHIDNDKLNNELWNLIALPKPKEKYESHIRHARIIFGDWNSGIKQLKEQCGLKKEDFHEHIKKHAEEEGIDL